MMSTIRRERSGVPILPISRLVEWLMYGPRGYPSRVDELDNFLNGQMPQVSNATENNLETRVGNTRILGDLGAKDELSDAIRKPLEDELKKLREELDLEKHLKQGAESSFEMMKEEYVRVTKALQDKYSHDTDQLKDIIDKVVTEKTREMKELESKLEENMSEKIRRIEELELALEETKRELMITIQRRDYYEQHLHNVLTDKQLIEEHLNNVLTDKELIEMDRDLLYTWYSRRMQENESSIENQFQANFVAMRERFKLLVKKLNISIELDHSNTLNDESSINRCFDEIENAFEIEREIALANICEETKRVIDSENKMKHIESEMEVLKNYYDALLSALKVENNALKDEALSLKSDILKETNKQKIMENLETEKMTALKAEYEVFLREIKSENIELKDEIINLKSNFAKVSEKVIHNENLIEKFGNEKSGLQHQYDVILNDMKMDNTALKDKIGNLQSEVNVLNSVQEKLEGAMKALGYENKNLENQNEELKNKNKIEISKQLELSKRYEENIQKLETELEKRQSEIQILTNNLIEQEQKVESLSKENDTLQTLVGSQRESIELLEKEKKYLAESLQDAINKADNVTEDLNCEQDCGRQLKEQLDALKNNLHSHEVEKQSNELILSKLKNELEEKHLNQLNLQRDLVEVVENLHRETDTVQWNEQMMESLENELLSELSDEKTATNSLRMQVSKLKQDIDQLVSDGNKLDCLNTEVLIMEDNLNLTLDMTKLLRGEAVSTDNDESSHSKAQDNIIKEMDNLIVQQLEQKNEFLKTKLQSTEFELEHLRKVTNNDEYLSKEIYYSEISKVFDSVKDELAALKQEISERDEREEELRKTFEQERQKLEVSIRLEKHRNEHVLESMERVIDDFERKSSKMNRRIQEEKWKNKELKEMLAKLGIKYGNNGFGQGDQH